MFPGITRDDVFRLETRRLWLRWPEQGDAEAVATIAGQQAVADLTAHVPHPYPKGEAARRIDTWRAENAEGLGLTLLLTGREADRVPFGLVGLALWAGHTRLGFMLAPERWGGGLATEAAQAMVDVAFMLSDIGRVEASVRVVIRRRGGCWRAAASPTRARCCRRRRRAAA